MSYCKCKYEDINLVKFCKEGIQCCNCKKIITNTTVTENIVFVKREDNV